MLPLIKGKLGEKPTRSRRCKRRVLSKLPLGNREGRKDDDA